MSNTLNSTKVISPENKSETVAHFSIDTPSTPFVMKNVVSLADDYVFSCFVKSDSTGSFKIGDKQVATSNKWTEVKIPFTVDSNGNPDIAIYFTVNGQYYFYHTQVERGEVPTKWQPSPDDVDENIQSVSTTQQASIEAMPGKIMAQVAEQYATKSDFSNITQRADSISTTVARVNNKVNDGSEIISTINQTAEDVSINASKINLNGVVTANNNFKILSDGSMEANNGKFTGEIVTEGGIKIVGGDGALSMFSFSSKAGDPQTFGNGIGGFDIFGYGYDMDYNHNATFYKTREVLEYYIPSNFIITNAVIAVKAAAIKWSNGLGYPRQIKIYSTDKPIIAASFASLNQAWSYIPFTDTGTPITGFNGGLDEWTPSLSNNTSVDSLLTQDIHNYINNGAHSLVFQCNTGSINTNDMNTANLRTGLFRAFLYVSGYLKVE